VEERCEQKRRLLAEYDSITSAFSACVSNLDRQIGTSSREAYEQLRHFVDEARVRSEQARLARSACGSAPLLSSPGPSRDRVLPATTRTFEVYSYGRRMCTFVRRERRSTVPEIVPDSFQNRAPGANSSQLARSRK
jgi:hypothetical protein